VIAHFVYIGRIVDHHCLNFSFHNIIFLCFFCCCKYYAFFLF